MTLNLSTLDQKISAIDQLIVMVREGMSGRSGLTTAEIEHYEALKAIGADLRARQRMPKNNALGALERELVLMKAGKPAGRGASYEQARMNQVANIVISKWPVIRQALEKYGEESAE